MTKDKLKENCELVSGILKTLSHPGRLMILCHLGTGEKTVSELEEYCGITQSQVSQFLKRMQYEKLVEHRKNGKFVYYKIQDEKVMSLINQMQAIFCPLEFEK